jgi:nicotinate-nucleotide adenylyltransferase
MPDSPICVLGGTFDPVHAAHLALAATAAAQLRLGKVIWVPTGQPWHRRPPAADAADRLAMVRLALADHPGSEVDDSEVRSAAPGYTVLTLERLRARFGTAQPLVLLLGADAFLGLPSWHRWQDLFRLAHVAVATRPGFELAPAAMAPELAAEFARCGRGQLGALASAPAGCIMPFELVAGTVSGTETRAMLARGEDPGDWLPQGILDYIRTHHLYGT